MSRKTSNRHLYILTLSLASIGIAIFLYKFLVLGFPLTPDRKVDTWDVEVRVRFLANNDRARVSLYLPTTGGQHEIVDERFISRNYSYNIRMFGNTNRKINWTISQARHQQYLFYRATIRKAATMRTDIREKSPEITNPEFGDAELIAVRNILDQLPSAGGEAGQLISAVVRMVMSEKPDNNLKLLLTKKPGELEKLQLITRILGIARLPARIVNGIRLKNMERNSEKLHWLEVYGKDKWQAYSIIDGTPTAAGNNLAWWYGTKPLATLEGGSQLETQISVALSKESALDRVILGENNVQPAHIRYSLLSLPLETQTLYHILLVVPVGVFMLVILRNVVGVKTFGTFMPVLIALSFRETQLLWGIGLFVLIISAGLIVRFYLDRLKLLLVPRLASVLIVVIMLMAIISIASYRMDLPSGLSIALFPMVILTMTIERMSIVWEERGPMMAIEQALGSLFAASLVYVIMNIDWLKHFLFLFPEMILLLLSLTMLMGRYTGYRLTELSRFRVLTRGPKP